MRVEKGVQHIPQPHDDALPITRVPWSLVTGGGARKRSAGLPDEEACVDDDDEEDD